MGNRGLVRGANTRGQHVELLRFVDQSLHFAGETVGLGAVR